MCWTRWRKQRFNINSLRHIKSFLSGVFRLALQQGFYEGHNPVREASIPAVRAAEETYAYSLEEIEAMLRVLPEPAATVVMTAALTGARRGELRGMSWENYHDGEMMIDRSIWHGHISAPKTASSKRPIPIIRLLQTRLENHRLRQGNPLAGPVFPNEACNPMDLNNLLGRVILPTLNQCEVCHRSEGDHGPEVNHNYRRDASLPKWHGWHAFRRGLGTNLHRLGVPDKTIQAILRHANVNTTNTYYIKNVAEDAAAAMAKLETSLVDRNWTGFSTLTAASPLVN